MEFFNWPVVFKARFAQAGFIFLTIQYNCAPSFIRGWCPTNASLGRTKTGAFIYVFSCLLVCLFFLYGQTGTERSRPLTAHWRPSFFLRCVRPEWLSLWCMCVCLRQTAASQCDVRRKVFGKGRGKANKKSKPYKQFFLKGIHPGTVYFCDLPGIWGQCARILFLPSPGKLPKTRWRTWKTDTMFLLK